MDRTIVAAWRALDRSRCRYCGRPSAIHKTDKPEDYRVASITCTAAKRVGWWVALWHKASTKLPAPAHRQAALEKAQRKDGMNPDAGRDWIAYTEAEGPPT